MNDTVISMWDWVLTFWSDGLVRIQEILSTSPSDFGGGGLWSIVTSIYGSVAAIGYGLLPIFWYIGLVKTTASFAELKRPEMAFSVFARFIITKLVLDGGLYLMEFIVNVGQGVIATIFSVGSLAEQTAALPDEIRSGMVNAAFLEILPLFFVTLIAIVVLVVMTLTILLSVYGRFFKIYCCCCIAPIPLSGFGGSPTQSMGIRYLYTFASLCLEGAIIAIACVLYTGFVSSVPGLDLMENATLMVKLLNYIVSVIFNTLVLSGIVKGAEWLLGKFMA